MLTQHSYPLVLTFVPVVLLFFSEAFVSYLDTEIPW